MAIPYNPDEWPACWILQLIATGNLHAFYNSSQWNKKRVEILKSRLCRCELCAAKTPAVLTPLRKPWEKKKGSNDKRPVAIVHHVNELRRRPDLALSEYDEDGKANLVIACPSCHWNEHHKRFAPVTEERW